MELVTALPRDRIRLAPTRHLIELIYPDVISRSSLGVWRTHPLVALCVPLTLACQMMYAAPLSSAVFPTFRPRVRAPLLPRIEPHAPLGKPCGDDPTWCSPPYCNSLRRRLGLLSTSFEPLGGKAIRILASHRVALLVRIGPRKVPLGASRLALSRTIASYLRDLLGPSNLSYAELTQK